MLLLLHQNCLFSDLAFFLIYELSVYKCTSLFPEISIPKSIKADKEYVVSEIGEKAFQNCSNISSVILPDSLKSIRKGAFIKCSSLEKINIPKSVNEIGDYCFHECVSLKKINFASFLTEYIENYRK